MLSFAGDMTGLAGVGKGIGFCSGAFARTRDLLAIEAMRPAEPLAMANVLSVKPTMHASAQALTTANFRGCLGIIPSSGIE